MAVQRDITLRKQAEEALAYERERLAVTLASIGDGVIATDTEGRIVLLNNAAEDLTGWAQEEAAGKPLTQVFRIINEKTRKPAPDPVAKALKTGLAVGLANHTALIAKDGRERSIADSCAPVRGADGSVLGAVLVFRDVTDERRAEEALRASEERFRSIAQTANDAIICANDEGRIVLWNRGAEAVFGYSADEAVGKQVALIMPERFRESHRNGLQRLLSTGKSSVIGKTVELVGLGKDGSEFPLELSLASWATGGETFFAGIARDITEKKQALVKLSEQEERYRTLFEQSPDSVVIIDPETAKPIDFNEAAHRQLGYSREEFRELAISDYEVAEDPEETKAHTEKVLREGSDRFETKHRTKDGEIKDVLISVQTINMSGREVFFSVFRDITEIKRAKELSDALNKINAAITSTLDFNEILQRVAVESAKAIGAESAVISLRKTDHWVARSVYGRLREMTGTRFSAEEAPHLALAVKTLEPLAVSDVHGEGWLDMERMKSQGVRSFLTVPLVGREEVIGAISFIHHSAPVVFSEAETNFAMNLAAAVSLAVQNARLYAAERKVADTLQEALLAVPQRVEGVDIGYLYRSATVGRKVGGDFYDVFELEHDRVGIVVGDVSGKGLEAATMSSLVRNTIRAYAYEEDYPAKVLAKTNEAVRKTFAPFTFVTVFFGILKTKSGILTYCSAGHPRAIIRRNGSGTSMLATSSPLIGAVTGLHYVDEVTTLSGGDILLVYTDGVTEARCDKAFFGEDNLIRCIECSGTPAQDLPQSIFQEIMAHTGGKLSDDVVLLAISPRANL